MATRAKRRRLPAQAAFTAGLVDALVEQSEFDAKLLEFCAELERRDALNLRPESGAMHELNIKAWTAKRSASQRAPSSAVTGPDRTYLLRPDHSGGVTMTRPRPRRTR
jgi:hypothetical protein